MQSNSRTKSCALLFFACSKMTFRGISVKFIVHMRDDGKCMNWMLFIEILCFNDVLQLHYQEKPPTDDERKVIETETRMLVEKYDEINDDTYFGRCRRQLTVDKLCHHFRRVLVHMTFNWGYPADLIKNNFDVFDMWMD